MNLADPQSTILAKVIYHLMDENGIELRVLAERCGVTYQTVKNVVDGASVSMRFVLSLIREFKIDQNPALLRRLLIGMLSVQFPKGEGARLLHIADLIPEED